MLDTLICNILVSIVILFVALVSVLIIFGCMIALVPYAILSCIGTVIDLIELIEDLIGGTK